MTWLLVSELVMGSLWLTSILVLSVLLLCMVRSVLVPARTWGFCPALFCSLRQIAWPLTAVGFMHEFKLIFESCYRCIGNRPYHGRCADDLVILLP